MNTNRQISEDHTFTQLVRTLLKLDPSALASLGAANGATSRTAAAGLHELMRRVLERALSLLWAPDDFTLHLHTNVSAKALRHNAKIHNLVELFAWALIRVPRRMRGSGDLALCEADPKLVHCLVRCRALELATAQE